jgi:lysophospholipase L1-like esterase
MVIDHRASSGWETCYLLDPCREDGRYGLAGHVFRMPLGGWAELNSVAPGRNGRDFARIELWYLAEPGRGPAWITVDGEVRARFDAAAAAPEARWVALDVPAGPHSVRVVSDRPGLTGYGVVLEGEGPGIVWDAHSMLGVFAKRLLRLDSAHIAEQVAHRDPDLVVFTLGGNDLRRFAAASLGQRQYTEELVEVLRHMRRGAPAASCLVVGINDHARSGQHDVTQAHMKAVVQAQRSAALAEGCGFFDTLAAMGGPGSHVAWRARGLLAADQKHLTRAGRDKLAQWLVEALIAGYVAYRQAEPSAPPPAAGGS